MSARTLVSSASRAAITGASLTSSHPNMCAPSLSIDILRNTNACTTRNYGIGSRRRLTTGARLLSSSSTSQPIKKDVTTNDSKNESPSRSRPGNHQSSAPSEDDFKVSFHDLGMNRITKFVVYAVIGVLGTMETIVWCKALWHWWTSGEDDE